MFCRTCCGCSRSHSVLASMYTWDKNGSSFFYASTHTLELLVSFLYLHCGAWYYTFYRACRKKVFRFTVLPVGRLTGYPVQKQHPANMTEYDARRLGELKGLTKTLQLLHAGPLLLDFMKEIVGRSKALAVHLDVNVSDEAGVRKALQRAELEWTSCWHQQLRPRNSDEDHQDFIVGGHLERATRDRPFQVLAGPLCSSVLLDRGAPRSARKMKTPPLKHSQFKAHASKAARVFVVDFLRIKRLDASIEVSLQKKVTKIRKMTIDCVARKFTKTRWLDALYGIVQSILRIPIIEHELSSSGLGTKTSPKLKTPALEPTRRSQPVGASPKNISSSK